jgi:hypothetical protein
MNQLILDKDSRIIVLENQVDMKSSSREQGVIEKIRKEFQMEQFSK